MYYVEEKRSRWATQAVAYATQDAAEAQAARQSRSGDCAHVLVWDCTDRHEGVLRAKYVDGVRAEQCDGDWYSKCLRPKGHDGFHHPLGHGA